MTALQQLAKDISRNFPTKEADSDWICPLKIIRYSDLPSQMNFEEGIIFDQDFFDERTEASKYKYVRRKVSKKSFRRDKVKLFLTKWRVGWTNTKPLPQMSPRVRLISAVDEGDYIVVTWAFKEWDVPGNKACEIAASDTDKEGWDILTTENSEREALSEIGKEVSTLEEVLKMLETSGSSMDETVLQDIEDMLKMISEREMEEESEADWENILSDLEAKEGPATESDEWDFDEENACVDWGKK
ncbi:hypothetical protein TWF696_001275 [Orbilia brochopaga]|uniref:Uncharacterized protein n=1 Tax=Orbilia brochopaga TaxID=3140254 RepID=A0AAV9UCP4_9PEZI